jgi:hypothetical protein
MLTCRTNVYQVCQAVTCLLTGPDAVAEWPLRLIIIACRAPKLHYLAEVLMPMEITSDRGGPGSV